MKPIYGCFLLFLLQLGTCLAQGPVFFEKSFTATTTNQEKFSMYLDSVNKYLYRDIRVAESAINECQNLIDKKVILADSLLLKFMIQQVYLKHSKAAPLEAFEIITQGEMIIDSLEASKQLIGNFNYIKGFTYFSVGDLEVAQKTYYEMLERAKADRDTKETIRMSLSIGQLLNDDNDPISAISYFFQILELVESYPVRPSTLALLYDELGESYDKLGKHKESLETFRLGYELSEKNDLQVLKCNFLLRMGEIHLVQHEIAQAKEIYAELLEANEGSQDEKIIHDTQTFRARLYKSEKRFGQALRVYQKLLNKTSSAEADNILDIYTEAYEVCEEMGDFESAYKYLRAFNTLKKERDEDEKRQKTKYLKIKFESEQKEQENSLLTAEILQNQTESKLLYSWMALSFLILFVLFGAFYQKGRYSKKLEMEVLNRTINLRKSNELLNKSNQELQEFNRILSHDLKEPLRSIIGFSQLASRKLFDKQKVQEYLGFVISSGEQLQHLIGSINTFHKANSLDIHKTSRIDMKELLEDILYRVQKNHPDKEINLNSNAQLSLFHSHESLKAVFEILFDNAAKYNEQDIVSLQINHYSKEETHYFEITDNGIGIDINYHEQIFGMFKRLNNRSQFSGSGMGLSIARKLMQRMGGEISLLGSNINEGSTFLLSFPEVEKASKALPALVG